MEIKTGDAPPIHLPAYRVGTEKKNIFRTEVKEMLDAGVIQPSTSPWASPAIVVPKPGGNWRLCIDYRKLNKITIPDPFPMPRTDETLDLLGRARYITTLDLTKGYYQIPMEKTSQPKTAAMGKFEFRMMPLGLAGQPSSSGT